MSGLRDWSQHAACLDEDPELFFPQGTNAAQIEEARAVCRRCDVRPECRDHALDEAEPFGVWGGLSEEERRRTRRRQSRERRDGPSAPFTSMGRGVLRGPKLPVDAVKARMVALGLDAREFLQFTRSADRIDTYTFREILNGRRKSMYQATLDKVAAAVGRAEAAAARAAQDQDVAS